jgi:hypothetical protein
MEEGIRSLSEELMECTANSVAKGSDYSFIFISLLLFLSSFFLPAIEVFGNQWLGWVCAKNSLLSLVRYPAPIFWELEELLSFVAYCSVLVNVLFIAAWMETMFQMAGFVKRKVFRKTPLMILAMVWVWIPELVYGVFAFKIGYYIWAISITTFACYVIKGGLGKTQISSTAI